MALPSTQRACAVDKGAGACIPTTATQPTARGSVMTERRALKLTLEALEHFYSYGFDRVMCEKVIIEIKESLAQLERKPVQVSPLEFVTMTLEKEHLVGKPIIWAQWPNEEKNT